MKKWVLILFLFVISLTAVGCVEDIYSATIFGKARQERELTDAETEALKAETELLKAQTEVLKAQTEELKSKDQNTPIIEE